MSDFKWLEDIVAVKTPGEWEAKYRADEPAWRVNAPGYAICKVLTGFNGNPGNNAQFIATMGTVAGLLMDVVRAAEDTVWSIDVKTSLVKLELALEALKQAGPKT